MCSFKCGSNHKASAERDTMVYEMALTIKSHLANNEHHRAELLELIAAIQKLLPPGLREI